MNVLNPFKSIVSIIIMIIALFVPESILGPHVPPANPDDLWISEDPNIWFGFDEERGHMGQIVSDGEVIEVTIGIGPGPQFKIYRYPNEKPEDHLVWGDCYFSGDKGTVTVTKDIGNVLGGAKTISFVRRERDTMENAKKGAARDRRALFFCPFWKLCGKTKNSS